MQRVTVLGLGIIGGAWVRNLHHDGLTVRAWNRTPRRLDYFEKSLERAVQEAELIVIVVADPPAVASILDQITPRLQPGQLVVQSSTISAEWTLRFAAQVQATGARFLEAPFTGSKPAAEARKTVFYLGGDETAVTAAEPVLARLSSARLHIGPLGSASTLKLAMNLNIALVSQGLIESMALTRAAGISDDKFFEALHLNVARSGYSDLKEPKLRGGDFSPQFSLKHMTKDLRLMLETAGALELPGTKAVKGFYEAGLQAGLGDDDLTGVARLLGTAVGRAGKEHLP